MDAQTSLSERAAELERQGYVAFKTGHAERSRDLNAQSLALAREAGDPSATVRALAGLMRVALNDRNLELVESLAQQCDEAAALADDRSLGRMPLHMRAEAARMSGELARARELYDASIDLNRELGNEAMVAVELGNKAWVEIASARLGDAERLIRESIAAGGGEDDYGMATSLLALARVELERGNARGVEMLGAAEAVLDGAGLAWDPAEQSEYAATLDIARRLAGVDADEKRRLGASDPEAFLARSDSTS